jgi:hypothetical protein
MKKFLAASSVQADGVGHLTSQIVARWPVRLAHESKSLARTDKSRTWAEATKKRRAPFASALSSPE